MAIDKQERIAVTTERFNKEIVSLISDMDDSARCVTRRAAGLGVVKLKNGRRAEIQLSINTDKDEWIKGK